MTNSYSMSPENEDSTSYLIEIDDKVIGQVALIEGAWRYRLDKLSTWSAMEFGSEFEASEFVLVDRDLLQVNDKGMLISHIETRP